jgi:hypothetical protein
MAATYDFLGKATGDSTSAVLTLSGIDQTYQDIEFLCHIISSTGGGSSGKVTLNGDTGSVYQRSCVRNTAGTMYGKSEGTTSWDINYSQGKAGGFGLVKIYIPDYASAVDHPASYFSTGGDDDTSWELALGALSYTPGSAAAITSFTWTGTQTIVTNSAICAYGINYS